MPTPEVPAGQPPALELLDVHASYGRIEVLHGVTLSIAPASVFALLGPNGAGKSTTLKVIGGNVAATSGCVHVMGTHVNGASPDRLARVGVCRMPEGRGVFPNLTVAEHLRIWTYSAGVSRGEVEDRTYARFPRLAERRRQLAGTLSGGEQQMLAMSRALAGEPGLLLLDEISMGLAPLVVADLYEVVGALARDGITVLLVEQFAKTALEVADHAAVMTHGRVQISGRPDQIMGALSDVYLGVAS
ncbi:MAG TPA: ABC transporter ATP-binding protein [Mycobacteriales bacterium]|nr:ABC transporter ATP-binding protein [Mycobacteriales bacterium]